MSSLAVLLFAKKKCRNLESFQTDTLPIKTGTIKKSLVKHSLEKIACYTFKHSGTTNTLAYTFLL